MAKQKDNIYDKSYKSLLEKRIPDMLSSRGDINAVRVEQVSLELQKIIERKPDFLVRCYDSTGQAYILHVEYQTRIDPEMVYRMHEYAALICRKFKLDIRQFVFYVGKTSYPEEATQLRLTDYTYQFNLWNIRLANYEDLLTSAYPEEVLLSIHSHYQGVAPDEVIKKILIRLRELAANEQLLKKYVRHLAIISNLENLEESVIKISEKMEIMDEKLFPSYQKGRKEGKREGKREGIKKGVAQAKTEAVIRQLRRGKLTEEEIAEDFDLGLEEVLALKEQLKNQQKG